MSLIGPHNLFVADDTGKSTSQLAAHVFPARDEDAAFVLAQPVTGHDGRSNWVWVRFQNGDLALAVFPQGDTYFSLEESTQTPHNLTE